MAGTPPAAEGPAVKGVVAEEAGPWDDALAGRGPALLTFHPIR